MVILEFFNRLISINQENAVKKIQKTIGHSFKKIYHERLLQKSLFVIPEVFIGNPVFFKTKDFWIPAFAGMT